MTANVIGKLEAEDLTRLRQLVVKRDAYNIAPDKYSANDIEQNEMSYMRLMGEIAERYNVEDSRQWKISQYTGMIIYGDWE